MPGEDGNGCIVLGREVGTTGFGLMSLTPPAGPIKPKAELFAALDAAIESGANFWDGGQFYGRPDYNSLHLLRDYFTERPEVASQVVLSMKGGLTAEKRPDGSPAFVRKSVDECVAILPPSLKKLDLFQCARVDPSVPIETTMHTLRGLVDEGKIGAVGLSEVKAETIRRANAIVPIAAVEVELSLFETSILSNGVADACKTLNIPIVAYSPLGKGLLAGNILAAEDIPESSMLRRLDKLSESNLETNLRLIQALHELSGCYKPATLPQLAISWVRHLSQKKGMPIMIPIAGSSRAENVRANAVHISLTKDDLEKIDQILETNKVIGQRSYGEQIKYMEG